MRNWQKQAATAPLLFLGVALLATPVASEDRSDAPGLVDFRMTTLEQAKKINGLLQNRLGAGETKTVMLSNWDGIGDRRHLIVSDAESAQLLLKQQMPAGIDSVSWPEKDPGPFEPRGSCDSDEECEEATDSMCENAGHDGVDGETVTITVHIDGSKTCSGDCESNGAVALVTCN